MKLRLTLDLLTLGLLLSGLAYWWLDNRSHEAIGMAMFGLVIVHNLFNRRWHGAVRKGRCDVRRRVNTAVILLLALAMLGLLATSVMISRDVLGFLGSKGGTTARTAHQLAAYWALLIVALHLGTRWQMVLNSLGLRAVRSRFLLWGLRLLAAGIAGYGIDSSCVMAFGAKLLLIPTLDMWDFHTSTPEFFLRYGSIVGLYVALAHYGLKAGQAWKRRTTTAPIAGA